MKKQEKSKLHTVVNFSQKCILKKRASIFKDSSSLMYIFVSILRFIATWTSKVGGIHHLPETLLDRV